MFVAQLALIPSESHRDGKYAYSVWLLQICRPDGTLNELYRSKKLDNRILLLLSYAI